MILEFVACTVIFFLLILEVKRLSLSYRVRMIPGPMEIPFVGCKYILMANKITDIEALCYEVCVEKTIKFFVAHKLVVVTSDPDLLKIILTDKSCIDRPYFVDFLEVNAGLTSAKPFFWRPLRKGLNITFSQHAIHDFIPIFDKNYQTLPHELEKFVNGKPFDIHDVISKAIFASISETIFHEVIDGDFGPHELEEFDDIICQRIIAAPLHLSFIYKMTSLYRRHRQIKHAMHAVFQKLINAKRAESLVNDQMATSKNVLDKLVTMRVNGQPLTDTEIFENLIVFFIGGLETTATALSYVLLSLGMHQDVQEKCYQEIIREFPDENMELNADNLKQLTYLDMVIKEAMRLFPPIPVVPRENTEDLDTGSYCLPKKTMIVINLFKLHRDPDLYGPDALEFNPEHFSPENVEKRHGFAFLPFTAGIRNCIGGRYAMTSMKIGLVNILRQHRITTPLKMHELVFKLSVTLKLANKFMVQVTHRTKQS